MEEAESGSPVSKPFGSWTAINQDSTSAIDSTSHASQSSGPRQKGKGKAMNPALPVFKPLTITKPVERLLNKGSEAGTSSSSFGDKTTELEDLNCKWISEDTLSALDKFRYRGDMKRKWGTHIESHQGTTYNYLPVTLLEHSLQADKAHQCNDIVFTEGCFSEEDEYPCDLDLDLDDILEFVDKVNPVQVHSEASVSFGDFAQELGTFSETESFNRDSTSEDTGTVAVVRHGEPFLEPIIDSQQFLDTGSLEGGDFFVLTPENNDYSNTQAQLCMSTSEATNCTASSQTLPGCKPPQFFCNENEVTIYFEPDCPSISDTLQSEQKEERFSPPSSLTIPFGDESEEEYDPNLNCDTVGEIATDTSVPQLGAGGDGVEQVEEDYHFGFPSQILELPEDIIENKNIAAVANSIDQTGLETPSEEEVPKASVLDFITPHTTEYISSIALERLPIQKRMRIVPIEEEIKRKRTWTLLSPEERKKPFVRPPFPCLVKEKSAVEGLQNKTVIRTCFRIGEALKVAGMGGSEDCWVELYARVTFSERLGLKQNIQFSDLYHNHPPFLSGSYNLFKACDLWETDSASLLGDAGKGKMVRVVGKVRKLAGSSGGHGGNGGRGGYGSSPPFGATNEMAARVSYAMQILRITETGWGELESVRGVVCGL